MSQSRQLAAIMFTDIVGYTILMGDDERKAFALLDKNRQLQRPIIEEFNGQWIKELGDGVMASFNTASDAVFAAIKIQETCNTAKDFQLRVGIHLGEVVFENNDVFGNGVNIASRIEPLGIPGSILISKAVRDQIKNNPDILLVSLGSFDFKNVSEPLEIFALANPGFIVPKREEIRIKLNAPQRKSNIKKWIVLALFIATTLFAIWFLKGQTKSPNPDSGLSIAVLPFRNLSSNQENDYFCAGVMESILDHLSMIKGLRVISRTSVEQYKGTQRSASEIGDELKVGNILEGGVMRDKDKVRIFAKLISAQNNEQLWSRTYDRQLTDIFSIQSEISKNIAEELNIKFSVKENAVINFAVTNNLEAYDFYLKGRECLSKFLYDRNKMHFENAMKNYTKALEIDSMIAPVYADMASAYWIEHNVVLVTSNFPRLIDIKKLCEKAISLDPNLPQAHFLLGIYYLWARDESKFIQEQQKALAISDNYALSYSSLGSYYSSSTVGQYEKGIEFIKKAITLDPFSSWTPTYYRELVSAYLNINAFEQAELFAQKERKTEMRSDYNYLVHIYLMQGKLDEAEAEANLFRNHSSVALRNLAEINTVRKNYVQAIELFKEFQVLNPNVGHNNQRFGLAYWLDGQKEEGKELLLKALQEYKDQKGNLTYDFCYDAAGIYATLGEKRKALDILQDNNCHIGVGLEYYAAHDPFFMDLWDSPEFQQIIQRRKDKKKEIRDKILSK